VVEGPGKNEGWVLGVDIGTGRQIQEIGGNI
jgi:hypothetical protein